MQTKPTKEVLLFGLQERYSSIHNIRDRVQSITLRVLGLLLGISGWLIQSKTHFYCNEKIFFIIVVLISMIILYGYFEDLKKGAISQINIASKLEKLLGFYNEDSPIYPLKRKHETNKRPFLMYHYILLGFGFFVLLVSIIYFV